MQVQVRHQPSFAVARLTPAPVELGPAEPGATTAPGHGVIARPRTASAPSGRVSSVPFHS